MCLKPNKSATLYDLVVGAWAGMELLQISWRLIPRSITTQHAVQKPSHNTQLPQLLSICIILTISSLDRRVAWVSSSADADESVLEFTWRENANSIVAQINSKHKYMNYDDHESLKMFPCCVTGIHRSGRDVRKLGHQAWWPSKQFLVWAVEKIVSELWETTNFMNCCS